MSDAYHFSVQRGSYTTVIIANMANTDILGVEIGIPNDTTGCDPTQMLWTPARRCGADGVVTNAQMPLIFDIPGDYRLVWNSTPNPDIVVAVDEGVQGGKKTVVPRPE